MGNSAPQNYLVCDGTAYNITDYPVLAGYFETQFGSKNYFGGDGTTTFAVPDLRGEFLRGTGTNSHTNQGNGASVGVHQDATVFPEYAAKGDGGALLIKTNTSFGNSYISPRNSDKSYSIGTGTLRNAAVVSSPGTTSSTADSFTSRPTNTSVLYCIATHDIYVDARFDYSTTEKVVGTWIDGKPIYQKSISGQFGNITDETDATIYINNGVSNLKTIINYFGICNLTNGSSGPINGQWASKYHVFTAQFSSTQFQITCNRSSWSNGTIYITLQYTKTTD